MNSNKISCLKYVFEQNKCNSSPILELSIKFASQICHENTNTPLDGTCLVDFSIDISTMYTANIYYGINMLNMFFKVKFTKICSCIMKYRFF